MWSTSSGTPQWAGLIAVADEDRAHSLKTTWIGDGPGERFSFVIG
jgi:hypothetical protein